MSEIAIEGDMPITVGDFINWLSKIDSGSLIYIYSHRICMEKPFNPSIDIHAENGNLIIESSDFPIGQGRFG